MGLSRWLSARCFRWVHGNHLIYNTCWEDPRLDRAALRLGPDDTVLVITSAGCNALDYLLAGAGRVIAVDLNRRQNALLELKVAALRTLDHDALFSLFGRGGVRNVDKLYRGALRPQLSDPSRAFWDRRIRFFDVAHGRSSFYFHGTTGWFAWLVNHYIDRIDRFRETLERSFAAGSVAEQHDIYHAELREVFWRPALKWLLGRDTTMSLLGVPRPQREQIDREFPGGIPGFIEAAIEAVFTKLPLADNYFWRVYLTGSYTPDCCPEYLKPENAERLRNGLLDRLSIQTNSVEGYLRSTDESISHYVLLDHMDWMSAEHRPLLESEWQAIFDRARSDARFLWRSAGLSSEFVDRVPVRYGGQRRLVGELLEYDRPLAAELHPLDRVHTYGSMHVAELAA